MEKDNEDMINIAIKLSEIRKKSPEDYFYLKGWINCLSYRGKTSASVRDEEVKTRIV